MVYATLSQPPVPRRPQTVNVFIPSQMPARLNTKAPTRVPTAWVEKHWFQQRGPTDIAVDDLSKSAPATSRFSLEIKTAGKK